MAVYTVGSSSPTKITRMFQHGLYTASILDINDNDMI